MAGTKKYEMMILLNEEFNDNELKTWAFNFAKGLQSLSASEISVILEAKEIYHTQLILEKKVTLFKSIF